MGINNVNNDGCPPQSPAQIAWIQALINRAEKKRRAERKVKSEIPLVEVNKEPPVAPSSSPQSQFIARLFVSEEIAPAIEGENIASTEQKKPDVHADLPHPGSNGNGALITERLTRKKDGSDNGGDETNNIKPPNTPPIKDQPEIKAAPIKETPKTLFGLLTAACLGSLFISVVTRIPNIREKIEEIPLVAPAALKIFTTASDITSITSGVFAVIDKLTEPGHTIPLSTPHHSSTPGGPT